MANKAKLINIAQKAVSRGQWDKAVSVLEKVLAEEPQDVRTMLKLGDVYAKKGDRERAMDVYQKVAEHHAHHGFFLKAVAVYKQILKLDSHNSFAALRIAELHEQLGLAQDAMVHYQLALPILEEQGAIGQALDVLQRVLDLDPENIAARIKLAESYSRLEDRMNAVKQFAEAATVLKQQGRMEDYVKVAERLIYHDPSRLDVVKDLAKLYLGRGDTKRGLAKLQICFRETPKDIETLTLLARAFSNLDQVQKTVYVYRELARVHEDEGRQAEAREVHRLILQHQPDDAEALRALGMLEDNPPPLPAEAIDFDFHLEEPVEAFAFPHPPTPENATGALPIHASRDLSLGLPKTGDIVQSPSPFLSQDGVNSTRSIAPLKNTPSAPDSRAASPLPLEAVDGYPHAKHPRAGPAPRSSGPHTNPAMQDTSDRVASQAPSTHPTLHSALDSQRLPSPHHPTPQSTGPVNSQKPTPFSTSPSHTSSPKPLTAESFPPPPRLPPASSASADIRAMQQVSSPVSDDDRVVHFVREAEVYIRYNLPHKAIEHLEKVYVTNSKHPLIYRRAYDALLAMNASKQAKTAIANALWLYEKQGNESAATEARHLLVSLDQNHPTLQGIRPDNVAAIFRPLAEDGAIDEIEVDTGEFNLSDVGLDYWSESPEPAPPPRRQQVIDLGAAVDLTTPAGTRQIDNPPPSLTEDILEQDILADLAQPPNEQPHQASHHQDPRTPSYFDIQHPSENAAEMQSPSLDIADDVFDFSAEPHSEPIDNDVTLDDELAEIGFFLDAELFEDAREALKSLSKVYPDHPRLEEYRNLLGEAPAASVEIINPSALISDERSSEPHSLDQVISADLALESKPIKADAEHDQTRLSAHALGTLPPSVDDDLLLDDVARQEASIQEMDADFPEHEDTQHSSDISAHDMLQSGSLVLPSPENLHEGTGDIPLLDAAEHASFHPSYKSDISEPKASKADDFLAQEGEELLSFLGSSSLIETRESSSVKLDTTSQAFPNEHYDQGMAYKQIGQLEPAAHAFRAAAKSSPEQAAEALEMLGTCLAEDNQLMEAVDAFREALDHCHNPDAATNLHYEMGNIYERLGDYASARQWFESCYSRKASHRDVERRLKNLPDEAIAEDTTLEIPKKRSKISYI